MGSEQLMSDLGIMTRKALRDIVSLPMASSCGLRVLRSITRCVEERIRLRTERRILEWVCDQWGALSVQDGPFEGMLYPVAGSVGSALIPKILGVYEVELHKVIREIISKSYPVVIVIGAGEGYYAVGLARAMRSTRVLAYEADADGQSLLRQMAEANGVSDRVEIRGRCTREELAHVLGGNRVESLILCDCEGGEFDLLHPGEHDSLSRCDLLVELHDYGERGPTAPETMADWFSGTHDIRFVGLRPKRPADLPAISALRLRRDEVASALDERREFSVGWMCMRYRRGRWIGNPR